MTKKILGLDINEDSITAVQVKYLIKGYEITACATIKIEGDGGLDNALKQLVDKVDIESDVCITSIPGEHISFRNFEMPFKNPKKLRQTIPFEIETMVPFSIDDLVIDFVVNEHSGRNEVLAASVKKPFVSEYLTHLKDHEISPDILDIRCVPTAICLLKQQGIHSDGIFLDIGKKRTTMILYLKGHIVLIRTFASNNSPNVQSVSNGRNGINENGPEQVQYYYKRLFTTIQNTIHAFGCQRNMVICLERILFTGSGAFYPEIGNSIEQFFNIPAEQINLSRDNRIRIDERISEGWNPLLMDSALALALRDTKQGQGFNFRKDEFEIKKQYSGLKKEIRRSVILFLVILSFVAVDLGVDYYFMEKKNRILDRKITEVFKQTFPEVKRIVDPLQQLKIKLNEAKKSAVSHPGMKGAGKVLDILKDISQRVPGSLNVHIIRMVIDPDTVRITGYTDTFNTVDNIKNGLESSVFFSDATISSANLDRTGKRVKFEIKLQRAQ